MATPIPKKRPITPFIVAVMILSVMIAFVAKGAFAQSNGGNTTAPPTTVKTTSAPPAPQSADPMFDWAVSLAKANLADAWRRATETRKCIPEQPMPKPVGGNASPAEKIKYLGDLAKIENGYLSEINSGPNHCAPTPAATEQPVASTGDWSSGGNPYGPWAPFGIDMSTSENINGKAPDIVLPSVHREDENKVNADKTGGSPPTKPEPGPGGDTSQLFPGVQ